KQPATNRDALESVGLTCISGSATPSVAIKAVPSVASLAPLCFSESSTSTTSRSVVPLGAFFERKTSSRYQPLRAGIGLAARNPTSFPSAARAVKYFFFSLCWKGSTVNSHSNLIALRRVVSQLLQRQAVSRINRSSTSNTSLTVTPARRA